MGRVGVRGADQPRGPGTHDPAVRVEAVQGTGASEGVQAEAEGVQAEAGGAELEAGKVGPRGGGALVVGEVARVLVATAMATAAAIATAAAALSLGPTAAPSTAASRTAAATVATNTHTAAATIAGPKHTSHAARAARAAVPPRSDVRARGSHGRRSVTCV